jgi:hypothetical protein
VTQEVIWLFQEFAFLSALSYYKMFKPDSARQAWVRSLNDHKNPLSVGDPIFIRQDRFWNLIQVLFIEQAQGFLDIA